MAEYKSAGLLRVIVAVMLVIGAVATSLTDKEPEPVDAPEVTDAPAEKDRSFLLPRPAPEASGARSFGDVDRAYALHDGIVAAAGTYAGVVTDVSVSGWHRAVDVTISSLLPGDARDIAEGLCTLARKRFPRWDKQWRVRVFLPVAGDRPAAVCDL